LNSISLTDRQSVGLGLATTGLSLIIPSNLVVVGIENLTTKRVGFTIAFVKMAIVKPIAFDKSSH
jgi:hypothetical protein